MAESVKISNLPSATSITPANILPSVDGALTQTSKITVEQIQDLGPGIDTVSDEHIKNGHIPGNKSGFSARNRVTVAREDSVFSPQVQDGDISRIQGYETYISDWIAATLFTAESGTDLRALINDSSTFRNGLLVAPGTETDPSYRFGSVDDNGDVQEESQDAGGNAIKSGFYADTSGSVSFSSQGRTVWRVTGDQIYRIAYRNIDGINVQPGDVDYDTEGDLVPTFGVTASATLIPAVGATQFSFLGHSAVARYFGVYAGGHAISWNGSVGANVGSSGTDRGLYTLTSSSYGGNIWSFLSAHYTDIQASRHDPYHRSWTGVTTNFHSPEDNYHVTIGPSGTHAGTQRGPNKYSQPWVGQLYFRAQATNPQLTRTSNIASVQYDGVNKIYTFAFADNMPDGSYHVLFNHEHDVAQGSHLRTIMCVTEKAAGYFKCFFTYRNPVDYTNRDPGQLNTVGKYDLVVVR